MPQEARITIWLNEKDFEDILVETFKWFPLETGGVLVGYWGNQNEVVVSGIIGPGPRAIHKRFAFTPDSRYHNKEIARVYEQSGRTDTYLGDWHTHPKSSSYLSPRDEKTLRSIADFEEARLQKPLMVVLGTRPFRLRAWVHEYQLNQGVLKSVITYCRIKLY